MLMLVVSIIMSAGSLTQLAAKGVEDRNLTMNPELTFFKAVYKHHTNFATQAISESFSSGAVRLGATVTATIPRKGDLVHEIWIEIDMSRIGNANGDAFDGIARKEGVGNETRIGGWAVSYVPEVARAMIKSVDLLIGGHVFDSHSAEWLHSYDQLYVDKDHQPRGAVGKASETDEPSTQYAGARNNWDKAKTTQIIQSSSEHQKFYMPLRFWFNNHCSQCLPLVALMYHEVEIRVKLRTQAELLTLNILPFPQNTPPLSRDVSDSMGPARGHTRLRESTWDFETDDESIQAPPETVVVPPLVETKTGTLPAHDKAFFSFPEHGNALIDMKLLINYTFLDKAEREMFAKKDHYYLIDQLTEIHPTWNKKDRQQVYDLGEINHPCKELVWCVRPNINITDDAPTKSDVIVTSGAGLGRYKWDVLPKGVVPQHFYKTGGHVKDYFNFDGSSYQNGEFEGFSKAKLVLNGNDRFEHDARFLREVVARDRYACVSSSKIYRYPFCKNPLSWKPSGSLNFSKIDQARLELDLGEYAHRNRLVGGIPDSTVFVFARVHNILKITSGMAGVMYN